MSAFEIEAILYRAMQEDLPAESRGSTGPTTNRGKARSSRNAIKHGIFSKAVLLARESPKEYRALVEGFRKDFQPEGMVEDVLVEKLACLTWRYRRLLNAEAAEIQLSSKYILRAANREKQLREEAMSFSALEEPPRLGLIEEVHNPFVLKRCMVFVLDLRQLIKLRGFEPQADSAIIAKIFGTRESFSVYKTYCLCADPNTLFSGKDSEKVKLSLYDRREKFFEYLDAVVVDLHKQELASVSTAADQENLEFNSSSVPEAPGLDRLLRYSASLERDFDRTLNQLERVQRMRRGQALPPTLNVNVST
jgi:hypothetical protein